MFLIFILLAFFSKTSCQVNTTVLQILTNQYFYLSDPAIQNSFSVEPQSSLTPLLYSCDFFTTLLALYMCKPGFCYQQLIHSVRNLPPHYKLNVNLKFYKLNLWSGSLNISASSSNHSSKTYFTHTGANPGFKLLCLVNWYSYNLNLNFIIDDNFDTDIIITYYSSELSTFGIRDVFITALLCHSRCLRCTGPNLPQCSQCINNADLPNCQCKTGYFWKSCGEINSGDICIDKCNICYPTCSSCINELSNGCTSCKSNYNLDVGGNCNPTVTCNLTQYFNSVDNFCYDCPTVCLTCLSSAFCTECAPANQYIFAENGTCWSICPLGTYTKTSTNSCENCHSDCFTCDGDLSSNCLTCQNELQSVFNGSCVTECPVNTYSTAGQCEYCDQTCESCNGSNFDNCLSCKAYSYRILLGSSCICNNDTFENIINQTKICSLCDETCQTCNGFFSTNCLTCAKDLNRELIGISCLCTNGSIEINASNGSKICQDCDKICKTCDGPNSDNCLSCDSNRSLTGNQCFCKDGFFENLSNECIECDSSCLTCFENSNSCSSCHKGQFLKGISCYPCQNNTFFDPFINGCQICEATCLTCTGPTNNECLSCDIDRILRDNTCFCKDSTFASDDICIPCHHSCLTCFGQTDKNCSTCSVDKIFQNNTCICPEKTYYDENEYLCYSCDYSCQVCNGRSENNCLSCQNSSNSIFNGKCLEDCPAGFFSDILSKSCMSCSSKCIYCKEKNVCEVCLENYTLESGVCRRNIILNAELIVIKNPILVKLIFSEYWQYLMEKLQDFIVIKIENYDNKDFNYKLTNIYNESWILMNYTKSISNESLKLNIQIIIDYTQINSLEYNLVDKNFTVPLQRYSICSNNEYYDSESKRCEKKHLLQFNLALNENRLKISLDFTFSFLNLENLTISSYSTISIEGLISQIDYNTTIELKNINNNKEYYLKINTTTPIINRPKLTYCLDIPTPYHTQYNLTIPLNCSSIVLLDWYPLSESAKTLIENTKKQGVASSFVSTNGMSTVLSSSSGVFLFGLMTIEMIYFLKYINVNYPINTLSLFENKPTNYVIFFQYNFLLEQDSFVLPGIYIYYGVSPYFLNNAGETLCQIAVVVLFAVILILVQILLNGRLFIISKILSILEGVLIWEVVILFIFMSVQNLFFYIACSLKFVPITSEGILNSSVALVILIILTIWFISLFYHTKKCQNYRNTEISLEPLKARSEKPKEIQALVDLTRQNNVKSKKNSVFPLIEEINHMSQRNSKAFSQDIMFSPETFKKEITGVESNKNNCSNSNSISNINKNKRNWRLSLTNGFDVITPNLVISPKIQKHNCLNRIFDVRNWGKYLIKYECLYEDLKCKTIWQKYYKLFYYIKQLIISILVPLMYDCPIPQIILINLIYGGFLLMTIFNNPFESKIIYVTNVVGDIICFSAIFSVLMIAFLDFYENQDYQLKMNFGWVIIFANISLFYWVILSGIVEIIYKLVFKYKQNKMNSKTIPL